MKRKLQLMSTFLLSIVGITFAQNRCGFDELVKSYNQKFPGYKQAIDADIKNAISENPSRNDDDFTDKLYTIQVVFHVVYNNNSENISQTLINQQIGVLNRDYSASNADRVNIRPEFMPFVSGDTRIRFALATTDPTGAPINGIERRQTNVTSFYSITSGAGIADGVKKYATGGLDPWDQSRYLNIWVCNFLPTTSSGQIVVGYATPPPGLSPYWSNDPTDPQMQGVVLSYKVIGDNNLQSKGRTAVHEVGHYLGLRHVWGDDEPNVGDDFIWDTPAGASSLIDYGPTAQPSNPCKGRNISGFKFTLTSTINGTVTTPASFEYKNSATYTTFYNLTTQSTDSIVTPVIRVDLFDSLPNATNIPDTDATSFFFAYKAAYTNNYYDSNGNIISSKFVVPDITLTNQQYTKSLVPNTSNLPIIEPLLNGAGSINHGEYNDFFEDYMYYTSDVCIVAFTNQQRKLMQNVLLTRRPGIAIVTINGINEVLSVKKLRFQPNPANNIITINSSLKSAKFEIFNIAGLSVLDGKIDNNNIDISALTSGVYTIKVTDKDETLVNKLIKE